MPPAKVLRRRLPTIAIVGLLHAAFLWLLLNGLPTGTLRAPPNAEPNETQITLMPAPSPLRLPKKRPRQAAAATATNAITPYFDPYTYHAPQTLPGGGVSLALAACDPGRYDIATTEVRAACDRIGMLIRSDPGHFGVTADIRDPTHWRRELARREAPFLAPCMTPNGPDVLYALACIYDLLFKGYDPEKRARYSE